MSAQMINGRRLEVVIGDITTQDLDAIGNAANAALRGGGGVDGAIHAAAGPELMAELRREHPDGTPTGTAVATGGHRLSASWIFHAVGPVWRGGNQGEAELLADAYRSCLRLADEHQAHSLGLPAISAGIYAYPLPDAARIALRTVAEHLRGETSLGLVRFVVRDAIAPHFEAALGELED